MTWSKFKKLDCHLGQKNTNKKGYKKVKNREITRKIQAKSFVTIISITIYIILYNENNCDKRLQ